MLYKKEVNAFHLPPKSVLDLDKDYPWSARVSDSESGLSIAMRSDNRSQEWWCSRYEGFRYFIHGTNELLSSTNRFQLQFGELTELLIKPKMTITEEDLRDYTLERLELKFVDLKDVLWHFFQSKLLFRWRKEAEIFQAIHKV